MAAAMVAAGDVLAGMTDVLAGQTNEEYRSLRGRDGG
jgi:hypothetical protein